MFGFLSQGFACHGCGAGQVRKRPGYDGIQGSIDLPFEQAFVLSPCPDKSWRAFVFDIHLTHDAAKLRDVVLVIRADEAEHRDVNHSFVDAYDGKRSSLEAQEENIK